MKKLFSPADLKKIESIITTAGERAMKFKSPKALMDKYENDASSIVTEVDIATEEYLKKHLHKFFPTIGFYSEESFAEHGDELEKEYCWVVDPIDGTLNFSRGLPIWAVSVGLRSRNKSVFGALFFPRLGEYFYAMASAGAFCNKRQIQLRKPDIKKLYGAVGTSLTRDQNEKLRNIIYNYNLERGMNYCTVYNYAYLARGSYDFAVSFGPALWDIAACEILVAEAGGMFTFLPEHADRKKAGDPYIYRCFAASITVTSLLKNDLTSIFIE